VASLRAGVGRSVLTGQYAAHNRADDQPVAIIPGSRAQLRHARFLSWEGRTTSTDRRPIHV